MYVMVQGLTGWFRQWRGRVCLRDFERSCIGQFIFFICFLPRIIRDVLSECSHHGHIPSVDTGLHGNESTVYVSMPIPRDDVGRMHSRLQGIPNTHTG